jgi:acetyltransferase
VGHIIVQNLLDEHFPGKVFPVNPKTDTLLGVPCYPSLSAIHQSIDLALIVVPAAIVPQILTEAGELGIKSVIIISAGFKEAGQTGQALEAEVLRIATQYHITLLGPNCLGFLHPSRALNASFAKTMGLPGGISFFSQSGALLTATLDATQNSLGYAHMVSIGNKVVLAEADFLDYFIEDPETSLIAFYTEDLHDATRLIELGKKALLHNPPKPLIALKSGTTASGASASSSHTGAVAGSNHAYDTLFTQAGILRAENLEHLVELLTVFSQNPLPIGNRLAIITNAGGMGVLATDAAVEAGLALATLSSTSTSALSQNLPAAAGIHNPIDVLGDAPANRYAEALRVAASDPGVDMILVIITPQAMTEGEKTAEVIKAIQKNSTKPLVAVLTDGPTLTKAKTLLIQSHIATLSFAEAAATALGSLARVTKQKRFFEAAAQKDVFTPVERGALPEVTQSALAQTKNDYLPEAATRALLEHYGFVFPKTRIISSPDEIPAAQTFFEGSSKLVLKVISPDIIHKSDVGGVVLSVAPEDLFTSYASLLKTLATTAPKARIEGILVAEMAPQGTEILLGLKEEPGLGTLVVAGMGGIYVEILKDVASRFAPFAEADAEALLRELKSYPLLAGVRGQEGVDLALLSQHILALSKLAIDVPAITELERREVVSRRTRIAG